MARKQKTNQDREWGEIEWAFASDLLAARRRKTHATERPDALIDAVRGQWPDSHPSYHLQIVKRFLCFDMKQADAVRAVLAGYSSPAAAMANHVIPKSPQVREIGEIK